MSFVILAYRQEHATGCRHRECGCPEHKQPSEFSLFLGETVESVGDTIVEQLEYHRDALHAFIVVEDWAQLKSAAFSGGFISCGHGHTAITTYKPRDRFDDDITDAEFEERWADNIRIDALEETLRGYVKVKLAAIDAANTQAAEEAAKAAEAQRLGIHLAQSRAKYEQLKAFFENK